MYTLKYVLLFFAAVLAVEALGLYDRELGKDLGLSQKELVHRQGQFRRFEKKYGKSYHSAQERQQRFKIFVDNMKKVDDVTSKYKLRAKLGITKFSDLTTEEFKKTRLGLKAKDDDKTNTGLEKAEIPDVELPDDFNWLGRNVVTRVKDQGDCGSCYAFSVTGVVESAHARNNGYLEELSEQQIVDCDQYDDGCNGGDMVNVYKAIQEEGGLETENDYPYTAEQGDCALDENEEKYNIQKALDLSLNETNMAKYLYKNGPVSVAVNAFWLQFYDYGILDMPTILCWPQYLDHAMLVVGFGTDYDDDGDETYPFWIVKNSWGEDWGEQGYARFSRGYGTCGIDQYVTTVIPTDGASR